ncbi:peptidylprolyl isomerase [Baekduia sp.]|jgi:hypothetical protein|uniref:peptidylprolyl isomerase n=1 Tax=Baekduia sp. TaxID=2600305 RepID=UPI002E0892EF|nr:peptidylprolyl isomerase [Baekduia sp.]
MLNKSLGGLAVLVTASLLGYVGMATASTPTAAQRTAFAALRGAPTTSVPAAVSHFIDSQTGRQFGVDARNVHRVAAPGGGSWSVLSGDSGLCVVFETKENISACADNAQAKAGALQVLLISPKQPAPGGPKTSATDGPTTQVGLVPDEVTTATATLQSGDVSAVVPNPSGLYAVKSGYPLASLALHRVGKPSVVVKMGASRPFKRQKPVAHAALNHVAYLCTSPGFLGCVINAGGLWMANWLPIALIDVYSGDGWPMCGNALNSNGTWAGTTFCNGGIGAIGHPYNQSTRLGWGGPGPNVAQMIGGESVGYN